MQHIGGPDHVKLALQARQHRVGRKQIRGDKGAFESVPITEQVVADIEKFVVKIYPVEILRLCAIGNLSSLLAN